VILASLGWTRMTSSLRAAPLKRPPGTSWNWIRISALRSLSAFPHLRMKGTPCHRRLLMNVTSVANVAAVDPFGTVSSSR